MIYADNAATTKIDKEAVQAMFEFWDCYCGNPSSLHSAGNAVKKVLEGCREEVAGLIGAKSNQIYFTSGGTEANNIAISSLYLNRFGNKILTSDIEHHSVSTTIAQYSGGGVYAVRSNCKIKAMNHFNTSFLKSLKDELYNSVMFGSFQIANNETGFICDFKTIAHLFDYENVPLHMDGVQYIGKQPIDLKKHEGITMLSASGHKFHAPTGTGFLFCRDRSLLDHIMYGGGQERSVRPGTENVAGILGMTVALRNSLKDREIKNEQCKKVEKAFLDKMYESGIEFMQNSIYDSPMYMPGIVNLSFKCVEGESIVLLMAQYGISISSQSACASGSTRPSHVLETLKVPKEYIRGSVRVSFNEDNTEDEARIVADKLIESVKFLQKASR